VACTAGILAILWRRQRREGWSLAWIAAALPVTFLGMEVIIIVVTDGAGEPYGRHLYPALVAGTIAIAAGLVGALGPRFGTVAVLAVVAFARPASRRSYTTMWPTPTRPDWSPRGWRRSSTSR